MDKLQQLIDAIEFEMEIVEMDYKNHVQVSGAVTHKMLDFLLVKAKELQAEQDGHKWAVVHITDEYDSPEEAKEHIETIHKKMKQYYRIVKIIEP